MGRLGTPVPDPTSTQNQCCTFPRHVSPPSLLCARALTLEEAGPGNVRVRGGGGCRGKEKQKATRDAALNRCPRLAPSCSFLKTQASSFFSQTSGTPEQHLFLHHSEQGYSN